MSRLLITGSSGFLGGNIIFDYGNEYDIFGIFRNTPNPNIKVQFQIDLSSAKDTKRILDKIKPDYIIHCAAISSVDLCETNKLEAQKSNVKSTENLVKSTTPDTRFIYISTDSVFDGTKGNYSEKDEVSPVNNYARTKLEGEAVVKQYNKNYMIVRTNFFGFNMVKGESFAEWIVNSLTKGKRINMFTDIIFSPVYVQTLSQLTKKLLTSKIVGILNISSQDHISKYEFGVSLSKKLDLDSSLISPISIDEFNFIAKRPKNISLNAARAKDLLGSVSLIEDEINKFCHDYLRIRQGKSVTNKA